jgi:hypothetical protein
VAEFVFHQYPLAIATFDSLMVLIMHLNSGKASNLKELFSHMFSRVNAGDQSPHTQIDANVVSDAPINVMACEGARAGEPQSAHAGGALFKDRVMNLMMTDASRAITNGANPDGNPKSVSDMVTAMGKVFNKRGMIKIGAIATAKFRELYGPNAEPQKHSQFCDQRVCDVNDYREGLERLRPGVAGHQGI